MALLVLMILNGSITGTDVSNNSLSNDDVAGPGGSNLPTAYGYCDVGNNTLSWGTSNVSCMQNGGVYTIEIDGVTLADKNYVAIITPDTNNYIPTTTDQDGNLEVTFIAHDGTVDQIPDFSFVIYAP